MARARKIGDPCDCTLCGGDGYVSRETARAYGRPEGDGTCPACSGDGRVPWRPLCSESGCMGLAVCDFCLRCSRHRTKEEAESALRKLAAAR